MSDEEKQKDVEQLFPNAKMSEWKKLDVKQNETPLFTMRKLEPCAKKIKLKEAPGPDGITPELVRITLAETPEVCLKKMMNKALWKSLKNGSYLRIYEG